MLLRSWSRLALGLLSFLLFSAALVPGAETPSAKSRTFLFTYAMTVTGLPVDKTARIWLPVPASSEDQDVKIESKDLPAGHQFTKEKKYGNQILYVETKPDAEGNVRLSIAYRVTRQNLKGEGKPMKLAPEQLAPFLQADARVPIDGKPLELLKGRELPKDRLALARALFDVVNGHMRYDSKVEGAGNGDAVFACASGRGNCTDLNSLFIALARSQKIPAQFEIGVKLPEELGAGDLPSYQCWVKIQPNGKGWLPVDVAEANKDPKLRDYWFGNLPSNRVALSVGRDIELVPRQAGQPLNYFLYPYVEVDGKPYPAEKIKNKLTYKDVEGQGAAGSVKDYDAILQKYVKGDYFNYAGLAKNKEDRARFDAFLRWQAGADLAKMSRPEQIAFYINAYNSCCIQAILDQYPVHTPKDIKGFFDGLKFKVAGEELTISQIEYDRLIAKYKDMRAHFAVVCADRGCLPLRNRAYTGADLDADLTAAAKRFVSDERQFKVDRDKGEIWVSKIFEWYGPKFTADPKMPAAKPELYLLPWLTPEDRKLLESGKYKLRVRDWDWTLNEKQER